MISDLPLSTPGVRGSKSFCILTRARVKSQESKVEACLTALHPLETCWEGETPEIMKSLGLERNLYTQILILVSQSTFIIKHFLFKFEILFVNNIVVFYKVVATLF